jgi:hypothetical protein
MISEFKAKPPLTSDSNSVTVSHFPQPAESGIFPTDSMSCNSSQEAIMGPHLEDDTSKPLSAASIRVVNSVLRAKVNEAAVRRDRSEDF